MFENLNKGCAILFILLALGCCAFLAFLVINKPDFIFKSGVDFLNQGANYQEYKNVNKSNEQIEQEITSQIKAVGSNDVYISEEDLSLLLRNKLTQLKDVSVDLEDNNAKVYWKLDDSQNPVLGEADLKLDDQKMLKITQLGTPAVHLPGFTYLAINNLFYKILDQTSVQTQLGIPALTKGLEIKDVKLLKDKLYLKVFIDIKLF